MPDISPTAIVESAARLAEDVRVVPFAYFGPEVQLGPGCIIDSGATVTTTEAILFEWCETAAAAEFKEISRLVTGR